MGREGLSGGVSRATCMPAPDDCAEPGVWRCLRWPVGGEAVASARWTTWRGTGGAQTRCCAAEQPGRHLGAQERRKQHRVGREPCRIGARLAIPLLRRRTLIDHYLRHSDGTRLVWLDLETVRRTGHSRATDDHCGLRRAQSGVDLAGRSPQVGCTRREEAGYGVGTSRPSTRGARNGQRLDPPRMRRPLRRIITPIDG